MKAFARHLAILPSCHLLLTGCVPLPPGSVPDERRPIVTNDFEPLGPGAKEQQSLHFEVRSYDAETARQVSRLAEDDYERIMRDTGLYSFLGGRPYPVTVYGDRSEYLAKTRMPEWSGGAAAGNTLVTYVGPQLESTLAHELTHVLFYEAFGARASDLRWLNEGLAVYEETQGRISEVDARALAGARARVVAMPMPFVQMFAFVPATEKERLVDAWYLQASDVVRFMVERGGRLGFSIFLRRLREGGGLDLALREGFPGQWADSVALEKAWLASLPR